MPGCKQCGVCCKGIRFTSICGGDDWERIYKYVMQKEDGCLSIRFRTTYDHAVNCTGIKANQSVVFEIAGLDILEKLKGESHGDYSVLWWLLDSEYCPFLRQSRNEKGKFTKKYYCELHGSDAKPEVCRNYPTNKEHAKDFSRCRYFDD